MVCSLAFELELSIQSHWYEQYVLLNKILFTKMISENPR